MTGQARPGDRVRSHGGIGSGKRGVVVATASGRTKVHFNGSGGTSWVRSRSLSPSGGSQLSWIVPIKAALILFLIVPVARFVLVYLWTHHGMHGFPAALGSQMGQGALAWGRMVLDDPLGALLHLGFLGLVSRLMSW